MKVTLVQELRKAEAKITQNIGTAQHLLNCTISGIKDDALPKEKVLELLQQVTEHLDNVSD